MFNPDERPTSGRAAAAQALIDVGTTCPIRFVGTPRIARRCRRIILQDFVGTLLLGGTGMALAAGGLLNPLLAALVHVAPEPGCILNSARLLPRLREPD